MFIRKFYISILIIFFYITSSYLTATHIHKKVVQQHADCKVCIMAKNLHSGDIELKDNTSISYIDYSRIILFTENIIYKTILKGFNSNAPPIS